MQVAPPIDSNYKFVSKSCLKSPMDSLSKISFKSSLNFLFKTPGEWVVVGGRPNWVLAQVQVFGP